MDPTRCYLVCATPRSGSTLLCHLLEDTGVAGRPAEYFEALRHSGVPRRPHEYFDEPAHPALVARLRAASPAATPDPRWSRERYDEYLAWAIDRGTTPNGVFGAKLMWGYAGDFADLVRGIPPYAGLPLRQLLNAVFPDLRCVRVVRHDKLRQAVSLWRAIQTSAWQRSGADEDQPATQNGAAFDFEAIDALIGRLVEHDAGWTAFFERAQIAPLVVVYEDLVRDREGTVRAVLDHVGVEPPDGFELPEPRLAQQADELNEAWVRAYRERIALAPLI